MTSTPDAVSTEELFKLLNGKTTLPAVVFTPEHPCELGLLIGLLVQRSENGPSRGHLAHALMCLAATLSRLLSRDISRKLAERNQHDSAEALDLLHLGSMAGACHQVEALVFSLIEKTRDRTDVDFDGSVADAFLDSIGVTRQEYEDYRRIASQAMN